jgi:hypothetical protein
MDLRLVRTECEKPGALSTTATSARDEIGRAVADKIKDLKSAKELTKVVEEILPQISAFLETPEEKSLRRIRAGMITAAIGLGAVLTFASLGLTMKEDALLFVAGIGLTIFMIGLGIAFNGWLFTIPKQQKTGQASLTFVQTATESSPSTTTMTTAQEQLFTPSVIEHTTHQLPDSQLRMREAKLEQRE